MKKITLLTTLSLGLLFVSCHKITETDPVGKSDFIFKNTRDGAVYFECELTGEFSAFLSIRGSIPANDQLILFSGLAGVIAYHPRPEEVFKSVRFCEDEFCTEHFYEQDPVADSLWEHEVPDGYAAWEYTIYSLRIE